MKTWIYALIWFLLQILIIKVNYRVVIAPLKRAWLLLKPSELWDMAKMYAICTAVFAYISVWMRLPQKQYAAIFLVLFPQYAEALVIGIRLILVKLVKK